MNIEQWLEKQNLALLLWVTSKKLAKTFRMLFINRITRRYPPMSDEEMAEVRKIWRGNAEKGEGG